MDAGPAGYRMADVQIDIGTRQVRRGDEVISMPPLSYELLLALVRRAPNVVTTQQLMEEVWTGRVVNDETIAKRVELVREALGDDSRQSRYITVVRGHGYRITAEVEPLAQRCAGSLAMADASSRKASRARTLANWFAIGALVIVATALTVWRWPRSDVVEHPEGAVPPKPVLAVLPLANLSSGESGEYFAAGMHDALIADLSKASGIKVISRTSTLPYRESGKSLATIAAELGVNLVMEGSVLRDGERVRITVQLLDSNDTHLWAEHYEGDLRDVLKLQSQVARAVAQAVKVKLLPREDARLAGQPSVNVESYELYLKGKELIESNRPDGFESGVALLTRAAEIDPANALPYARLALAYALRAHAPGAATSLYPRATAYALQAIGLDGDLADGHEALAELRLYFHWDWKGAEESFRKVFELTPSFAPAHAHYGWLLVLQGDWEGALRELRLASELDPHDQVWRSWLAWVHLFNGEFEAAERETKAVLAMHPNSPVANHVLGQAYLRMNRVDEALAVFGKAAEANPRWSWGLPQGLAYAGRMDEARALALELEKSPHPDSWALAEVYCAIGDLERAVDWIEQGYEVRRDWLPWIKANTFLEPIHDHPRFREIVRRLDLPDAKS